MTTNISCQTPDVHAEHVWNHEGYHAKYGPYRCPGITTTQEVAFHGVKPEIVVLCGSTRFKEDFERVSRELGMQGKIVLSVSMFGHAGDLPASECRDGHPTKTALDELHKRKIDLADSVLVINPDGYLGTSTRSEIRYAWSVAHKPVRFMWTMPDDHHDGRMHGLCSHGEPRGTCPGVNSYDIGAA